MKHIDKLDLIKIENGWDNEDLANETKVSLKIINNMYKNPNNTRIQTIEKIGYNLGLIPIVISNDGRVEDLDEPGYFYGEHVENYINKCIDKFQKYTNLSQRKLAKSSGISQGEISQLEHKAHSLTVDTLEKLADGLGLEVRYFVPKQEAVYDDIFNPVINILGDNLSKKQLEKISLYMDKIVERYNNQKNK